MKKICFTCGKTKTETLIIGSGKSNYYFCSQRCFDQYWNKHKEEWK